MLWTELYTHEPPFLWAPAVAAARAIRRRLPRHVGQPGDWAQIPAPGVLLSSHAQQFDAEACVQADIDYSKMKVIDRHVHTSGGLIARVGTK